MLHPHTELRHVSEAVGYGVFATRLIPKGTITWVRDALDQVISADRVAALSTMQKQWLSRYGYQDGSGNTVLCGDNGRFMNHSCAATCLSPGFHFEIAIRDIPAGTELTDDYGALSIEDPFVCACGAPGCRGTVLPDDGDRLGAAWDRSVAEAFPLVVKVEQPLWHLLKEKAEVEEIIAKNLPVPSWDVHYFRRR